MSSRRAQKFIRNRLRVGFATPSLGRGGAERWILTLCRCFSKKVQLSGILTWDIEGALAEEARQHTRLFWPYESEEFFAGCDVVIAWGLQHFSKVDGISSFKGRVVGCSHGISMQPFHRKTSEDLASIPGCLLTAVSEAAVMSFPEGSKVTVIPNGVEVDRCTPRIPAHVVRKKLGIKAGQKVALFFGRLGTEKRPGLVAQAVLQLAEIGEDWVAVICGYDIEGEGAKLPRHERIKHLEPQESPGDLLNISDVFVLPSISEAHPLALTEAWVAGVPTVYCDWPFAEQIRKAHGMDLGAVIPVNFDLSDLSVAISVSLFTFAEEVAQVARRVSWECYTAAAMAARWEDFLGVESDFCRIVAKHE